MDYKIILAYVSIILTVVGYIPYVINTIKGKTKPHAFSWIIFSLIAAIAFFAQVSAHGGAGTWMVGFSSIICLIIFILALVKGSRHFDKTDWFLLGGALLAILIWLITSKPLLSVILVSITEIIAIIPALRKGYHKPYEETLFTYFMNATRFTLGIIALQTFNITTWLFPATIVMVNIMLVSVLLYRRSLINPV